MCQEGQSVLAVKVSQLLLLLSGPLTSLRDFRYCMSPPAADHQPMNEYTLEDKFCLLGYNLHVAPSSGSKNKPSKE
jgi:hypothetical protein